MKKRTKHIIGTVILVVILVVVAFFLFGCGQNGAMVMASGNADVFLCQCDCECQPPEGFYDDNDVTIPVEP